MKKLLPILLALFGFVPNLCAQTTLMPGDIAFTLLNMDGNNTDAVGFVLLTDVTPGTELVLTDDEYVDGVLGATSFPEGRVQIIFNAAFSCGTEIFVQDIDPAASVYTFQATTGPGNSAGLTTNNVGPTNFSLSTSGETIFAFQDADPNSSSPSRFVAALANTGGPFSPSNSGMGGSGGVSQLPASLTLGTSAVALPGSGGSELDNYKFNCTGTTGTPSQIAAAILNGNNWNGSNTALSPLTPCNFTCQSACIDPVLTSLSVSPAAYCVGDVVTITVNGQLNDAANWTLHEIDCTNPNTTPFTGNSIQVTVTGATTYGVTVANCAGAPLCATTSVSPGAPRADAGPDQTLAAAYPITLAGNTAAGTTGAWTEVAGDGGGSFGNAASPTSSFTGTPGVLYTLRWSLSGNGCPANGDEVQVSSTAGNTTLGAGDVLFTLLNASAPDAFAFVLTTDVTAGTTFDVTDNEFRAGGLTTGEGTGRITFLGNAICGSEFLLTDLGGGDYQPSTASGTGAIAYTQLAGSVLVSTTGETLIAYQGGSFITVIMNCDGDFGDPSSACSDLPTGLTAGQDAFAYINGLTGTAAEPDNIRYDCSVTGGSAADLGAALTSQGNWQESDLPFNYGTGCGFSCVTCVDPVITSLTPSTTTPCPGETVTLIIDGMLNGAAQWEVFDDACGGNVIASSSGNTLTFPATVNGDYFVAGTNGCVVTPTCSSFSLTLSATFAAVAGSPIVTASGATATTVQPAAPTGGQTAVMTILDGDGLGAVTLQPGGTNTWEITGTSGQSYTIEYRHEGGSCPTTRDTFVVSFSNPTDLSIGDIAFTGINTEGAISAFSFVALRDIGGGTEITFTDRGWNAGFLTGTNEATMTLTLLTGISCGESVWLTSTTSQDIIDWRAEIVGAAGVSAGTLAQVGSVASFQLGSTGDQVFAYQGAEPTGETAAQNADNFLAAISTNCSGGLCNEDWDNQIANATQDSDLPDIFNQTEFAVLISPVGSTAEVDNGQYDCAAATTTTAILGEINTRANWQTSMTQIYDLSSSCITACLIPPTAVCQDITVQIDAGGMPTINGQAFTPQDLDGGSTDDGPLGASSFTVDNAPDCADVMFSNPGTLSGTFAPYTATLTVTDAVGQTATCTSQVTVEDNVPPTADCNNIVVDLNASGQNTFFASGAQMLAIAGNFQDNCGATAPVGSQGGTQFTFTCADLGDNRELYGFRDGAGQEAVCSNVLVQVNDPLDVCGPGTLQANCQDFSAVADNNGNYTLEANNFDDGSVADRGLYSLAFSNQTSSVGQTTVSTNNNQLGHGQSFVASQTGVIQAISVGFASSVSDVTVHFYNSATGSGTVGSVGTPAYSQTGVELLTSVGGALTRIVLDDPFPVVQGQAYSFVFEGFTDPFYSSDPNSYADGDFIFNYDLSSGCCTFGDLVFEVEFIGPTTQTFTGVTAPNQSFPLAVYAVDKQGNVSAACNTTFTLDRALPVEWLTFGAAAGAKRVDLNWETTYELNNAGFTVQRSFGGVTWQSIGTVEAHNGVQLYDYVDFNPLRGRSYYRLMQTDFDGTETFSPVRQVFFSDDAAPQIFPNPTTGKVTVLLPPGATIEGFFDLNGRFLDVPQTPGEGQVEADLSVLPAGMYLLRTRMGDGERRLNRVVRK